MKPYTNCWSVPGIRTVVAKGAVIWHDGGCPGFTFGNSTVAPGTLQVRHMAEVILYNLCPYHGLNHRNDWQIRTA